MKSSVVARGSLAAKFGLGALGVYISSRFIHRIAKLGALGLVVGAVCFHRELALLLGGSDRLTSSALALLYSAPPERPPVSRQVVRLSVLPGAPRVMAEPLLGFAIDTSQVVGGRWWARDAGVEVGRGSQTTEPFDFRQPKLRKLARALAPARLRIGGTEADHVVYGEHALAPAELPHGYEYTFTRAHWNAVVDFARDVGFSLMFTVNAGPGPRDEDGAWQADNARVLLDFARQNSVDTVWELGNEVNGYWFIHGWSARLSGSEYARDFHRFRGLIRAEFPNARVAGPAGFLWPVMGEPFNNTLGVFEDYLKAAGSDADIVTWHYYPQQSRRCPLATRRATANTLLHPGFLDETERRAQHLEELVARYAPQAELWLGETGNAQCGGEPGVSDRFASSLWYLDQLGALGRRGQPMIRQTLVGSHYGMLDPDTLEPRPDYWAALLARRLTSGRRLLLEQSGENPYLRSYAACTPSSADRTPGSVTYWFVNLSSTEPARVNVDRAAGADWYRVTAPSLNSSEIWLNGQRVRHTDHELPALTGKHERTTAPFASIAPASYAFAVVNADAEACR